jgi:phosphosulfolactate synthase
MTRAFKEFIPIPEETGKIMVLEKEFGITGARDWAKMASGLANIIKFTFGTAALYQEDIIKEKVSLYENLGVNPMIGGTLTEIAIMNAGGYEKDDLLNYLKYAKALGFVYLEFSDGSIYIPEEKREDIIKMCLDEGFKVISEVGKKDPQKDAQITTAKRIELMQKDLQSGSEMVIIEARESGKGIGVMNKEGKVQFDELDKIMENVGIDNVMIEAPDKGQQQDIFMRYGPKANVGNIQPRDILSVAGLRTGLRGDTISALRKDAWKRYHAKQNAPEDYNI